MNEETIRFGRSQHLIGTVTRPALREGSTRPRMVALLTNAGVISRIGPRRINVRIAHRLAAQGIPCLRWDLSGLGDSGRSAQGGAAGDEFLRDTADAMQTASALFGSDAFVMIGFCSGAQVAFRTALRDDRLKCLVLFDHFKFSTYRSTMNWWVRRCRTLGPLRLVPALVRGVSQRLEKLAGRILRKDEQVLQNAELADPSLVEYALLVQALIRRGARILFVYSGGFSRIFNYAGQFDDLFRDFDIVGRAQSVYLPNADHLITSATEQNKLIDLIVAWTIAHSSNSISKPPADPVAASRAVAAVEAWE